MPDQAETLDDVICLCGKAAEDFFKHFSDLVAFHLLKRMIHFREIQCHFIVELVAFITVEKIQEKLFLHCMCKHEQHFIDRDCKLC